MLLLMISNFETCLLSRIFMQFFDDGVVIFYSTTTRKIRRWCSRFAFDNKSVLSFIAVGVQFLSITQWFLYSWPWRQRAEIGSCACHSWVRIPPTPWSRSVRRLLLLLTATNFARKEMITMANCDKNASPHHIKGSCLTVLPAKEIR